MMGLFNKGCTLLAALAMIAASAAQAQAPDRKDIYVPGTAQWQHAATSMILKPRLGILKRGKITSTAPMELDVQVQYETDDGATFATVFIYRPAAGDLSMWFDRATASITASDRWSIASTLESGPFIPPGSEQASGLRAVYALGGGKFTATGITMLAMGQWVAKIRVTSASLDAASLNSLMATLVSQITWPESLGKAAAATPVAACASPIAFGKAARPSRRSKDDAFANALIGAVMTTSDAGGEGKEPPKAIVYCRDSLLGGHGIYRANAAEDGYVLAFGDSGRAATVHPSMSLFDKGKTRSFAVSYLDLARTFHYLDHDRLVPPAQLIDIIDNQKAVSAVSTTGESTNITVDPSLTRP